MTKMALAKLTIVVAANCVYQVIILVIVILSHNYGVVV